MNFTQFKRSSFIVGTILVVGAISFGTLDINENNKLNSTKTSIVSAKAQYRHEKSQKARKQRIIHKTVPSSFKLMMIDGHTVSNAENTILKVNNKLHGKVDPNLKPIRDSDATLSQLLTVDGQTDNEMDYSQPWVTDYDSHVKIIPGAANDNNVFTCAFLIQSPKGQDKAFMTATYDPSARKFDNIQYFGSSNAGGDPNDNLKDFRTRLHQAMAKQQKRAQEAKAQKAKNKAKSKPQPKSTKPNAKKPQNNKKK